jgi:hypothetical protein
MNDCDVWLQAYNFHLPGTVHVIGLVTMAVLAVQVLGNRCRPELNSTTQFDELFFFGSCVQDADVIQNDRIGFLVLELLLLGQPLVVWHGVDTMGGCSWTPSVQLLIVNCFCSFNQIFQNFQIKLFNEWGNCDNALSLCLEIRKFTVGLNLSSKKQI